MHGGSDSLQIQSEKQLSSFENIQTGLLRLQQLSKKLGLSGRAFGASSLEEKMESSKFDSEKVLEAIKNLENLMSKEGERAPTEISQEYEISCINRALWTFGLRSKFDLSEYIEKGDVIEIYNADFFQLYRNLLFFELTGYEFSDLINYQFHELYSRPEFVTQKVIEHVQWVFQNEKPLVSKIPPHEMIEVKSSDQRSFTTEYRYIVPLHDAHGNCAAILSTIRPAEKDMMQTSVH